MSDKFTEEFDEAFATGGEKLNDLLLQVVKLNGSMNQRDISVEYKSDKQIQEHER